LRRLRVTVITMSRMQDWLVEALNAENLTISAAAKHPGFSLLDRQRLQTWQRKLYAVPVQTPGPVLESRRRRSFAVFGNVLAQPPLASALPAYLI